MTLLPAEIPPIPETRAEVVPARLARKVAPLFGVPWPDSPLGPVTWVTDFNRVTLSEIARGAPLPTRAQSAAVTATAAESADGWAIVDRIGGTGPGAALPNEIANATLNRYGPDTRAAVVLTAVNRLLDPLRAALDATIGHLVDETGEELPPDLRLAGWATVVIEVFRSQPALVAAGIRARSIQRPLATPWYVPVGASARGEPLTRCEISAPWTTPTPLEPRDLEIVDLTIGRLRLSDDNTPVARDALHETLVSELLYRLLDVGGLRDNSHLWISARGPGQLAVEALLLPATIVNRYVSGAMRRVGVPRPSPTRAVLPAVPDAARLSSRPVIVRRAVPLALLGVVRQILLDAERDHARGAAVEWLGRLRDLVVAVLPDDDPARAVLTCRIDLTTIDLLRHRAETDMTPLLARLVESTGRCVDLFDAGVLDRGAAAEVLSAANVELNAHRRVRRPGAPDDPLLAETVRARWDAWLRMVEAPDPIVAEEVGGLLGYHLHNYAAYLATERSEEDLVAAVELFRDIVIPAREKFTAETGVRDATRTSFQMGAMATTALAELAATRGDRAAARGWASLGYQWISTALQDEETKKLVEETSERTCRFALRAVPALVVAAELGAVGDRQSIDEQLDTAAVLLGRARGWVAEHVGQSHRYARHSEIETLSSRLDRLRAA